MWTAEHHLTILQMPSCTVCCACACELLSLGKACFINCQISVLALQNHSMLPHKTPASRSTALAPVKVLKAIGIGIPYFVLPFANRLFNQFKQCLDIVKCSTRCFRAAQKLTPSFAGNILGCGTPFGGLLTQHLLEHVGCVEALAHYLSTHKYRSNGLSYYTSSYDPACASAGASLIPSMPQPSSLAGGHRFGRL